MSMFQFIELPKFGETVQVLYIEILKRIYSYYTIDTQKRTITPIDENKYPALLHNLRPG